jgi:hypothetical protein
MGRVTVSQHAIRPRAASPGVFLLDGERILSAAGAGAFSLSGRRVRRAALEMSEAGDWRILAEKKRPGGAFMTILSGEAAEAVAEDAPVRLRLLGAGVFIRDAALWRASPRGGSARLRRAALPRPARGFRPAAKVLRGGGGRPGFLRRARRETGPAL